MKRTQDIIPKQDAPWKKHPEDAFLHAELWLRPTSTRELS